MMKSEQNGTQAEGRQDPSTNRGIRRQLLGSYVAVGIIGVLMLLVGLGSNLWLRANTNRLATVRGPTVRNSTLALSGAQRSLAALRGWAILGDPAYKEERALAWSDEIRPSLAELISLSDRWDEAANEKRLAELVGVLDDFEEWQWWVEDVAQVPGNEPARVLQSQQILPIGDRLTDGITTMIDLHEKTPGGARSDALLAAMADFRFYFTLARSNLLDSIDEGKRYDQILFRDRLDVVKQRLQVLIAQAHLLTPEQREELAWMKDDVDSYESLAAQAIDIRGTAQWNRARHWLAEEVGPRAKKVTKLLTAMSDSQNEQMLKDAALVGKIGNLLIFISLILIASMALSAFVVSHRGAKQLTGPIEALSTATQQLAAGRLSSDIPIIREDELGQLTRAFNTMRTSLEQSEEAVRQNEQRLKERNTELERMTENADNARKDAETKEKSLAEAQRIAHLGSWVWEIATNELIWSDEVYRIFGFEPQEFSATYDGFMERVHPDDRKRVQQAVDRALRKSTTNYTIDHRLIRPDGAERIVHENGEVEFGNDEKPVRMIGTVHDVTDRRKLESQILTIGAKEQRRIGQELHDGLGQELTGLSYLAKNLHQRLQAKSMPEAEAAADLTEFIPNIVGQLQSIVNGLLPLEKGADDLVPALELLAENVQERTGIPCRFEGTSDTKFGDDDMSIQLYRIAQEAVNNAVKHSQGQHIVIALRADNRQVILEVQDDGVGIGSSDEKDLGSGLRIMQYRAQLVGGSLDIQGRPDGGTLITCAVSQE